MGGLERKEGVGVATKRPLRSDFVVNEISVCSPSRCPQDLNRSCFVVLC